MHPGSGPLRLGALLAVAVQGGENTADIGGRPCTLVVRVAFDTPLRLHRFHLIGAYDLPHRATLPACRWRTGQKVPFRGCDHSFRTAPPPAPVGGPSAGCAGVLR
jgi:hypothetical protein